MSDPIDTDAWECEYVMVPVRALDVRKVEHEVVEWQATFCSEDAIPVPVDEIDRLRAENERLMAEVGKPLVDRLLAALNEHGDSAYRHVPDNHARIDGQVVRLVADLPTRDRYGYFSERRYVAVPLDSGEAGDGA